MNHYRPIIGLEIHAELSTKTKMFCRCPNPIYLSKKVETRRTDKTSQEKRAKLTPNTLVCPVCLGMPGSLPVMNETAVKLTMRTGQALNCTIAQFTKWDRKNYFYPDLPKNYQISQYDLPLAYDGFLDLEGASGQGKIRITRIHLEEDTGQLVHLSNGSSLVDYNRAGVPLIELVTQPDIDSAEQAKQFAKEYQQILRVLAVSSADMEQGEMRVEVNVSLTRISSNLDSNPAGVGTKVEVKNLNSFRSVERAINYEINRQTKILDSGIKVVQETRGWDESKQKTFSQRVKETAADYRYFPEPDLPPIDTTKISLDPIPELPINRRRRYIGLGITDSDAKVIVGDRKREQILDQVITQSPKSAKKIANFLVNKPQAVNLGVKELTRIARFSAHQQKQSFKAGRAISQVNQDRLAGSGQIVSALDRVFDSNQDAVDKYKAGKKQVIGFLVGQVMSELKGQADPGLIRQAIEKALE